MELYEELLGLVDALEEAGLDYALCGGMAVVIYGYPRLTKDIDILIREEDLSDVLEAVRGAGFTIDSGRIPFGVGTPDESAIYRVLKIIGEEILMLDLMLLNPALDEVWTSRGYAEWEGKRLQIVSLEGLAKLKRRAGRSQDIADLEKLGLSGNEDQG